mgnify:CR=1 FL=1
MFNAIAHALLALAPEFDAVRVEDVPMSLRLDRWFAGQHPEGDVGRQVHGASLLCKLATWPRARQGVCKTSG